MKRNIIKIACPLLMAASLSCGFLTLYSWPRSYLSIQDIDSPLGRAAQYTEIPSIALQPVPLCLLAITVVSAGALVALLLMKRKAYR